VNTNQPLIYKGTILIATRGDKQPGKDPYDKLYVFDKDGNLLWSFSSPDGGNTDLNGVVACDWYILTTSDEGYVYALSWSGKVLWKTKLEKWPLAFSLYDFTGDGTPDALIGTGGDNTLYLLNGKTGNIIWKFKTGADIDSSPAIGDIDGDGKLEVVFGSRDNYLYALNGEDGSLLWKFKTGSWIVSSPALGDLDGDGKLEVVFGSWDYYLYALNGEDGSLLWKFKTGDWIDSSPALGDLDGDGKLEVVFGSGDNYLYALNGEDGSLLWKFKTGGPIASSSAIGDIDGDGKLEVVFSSGDNYLYALNSEDGSLLWKFKTGDWIVSSPALGDLDYDGKLEIAVVSRDGYLYYFEVNRKGGRVVWSRWHGDAYGTGAYWNAVLFANANLKGKPYFGEPVRFYSEPSQALKCEKGKTVFYKGKEYVIPANGIFIVNPLRVVLEPPTYSGVDLSLFPDCKELKNSTPRGIIRNFNAPVVEFILFWNSDGRRVERVTLNGENIEHYQFEDFVETTPIVGNLFSLKNFTLQVRYTNGQTYSYGCYIDKKLQITCSEFPKFFVPSFK